MSDVSQDLLPKPVAPQALIGLASPLWGLFAGAAASGVAFWWMTRWTRPQNLEAMFGAFGAEVAALPEQVAELMAEPPELAVGGEAAPVSALEEALVEAAPVETVVEAAAEAVETVVDAQAEVVEAVVEAAPEPVAPEPVAPEPLVEAAPTPKPKPKAPAEPRSVAPRSQPAAQPK